VTHARPAISATVRPGSVPLRPAPAGLPNPNLQPPTIAESGDPFSLVRILELTARLGRGQPIRVDDIAGRPDYAESAECLGPGEGGLMVRSYLAVPVISRSGETLGGLFFGHSRPGVFTERDERIVSGIAGQAAVSMDNAKLFRQAKQAIEVRDHFVSIASHELNTVSRLATAFHRL